MPIQLSKLPGLYCMYPIVIAWQHQNFFVSGATHLAFGKEVILTVAGLVYGISGYIQGPRPDYATRFMPG